MLKRHRIYGVLDGKNVRLRHRVIVIFLGFLRAWATYVGPDWQTAHGSGSHRIDILLLALGVAVRFSRIQCRFNHNTFNSTERTATQTALDRIEYDHSILRLPTKIGNAIALQCVRVPSKRLPLKEASLERAYNWQWTMPANRSYHLHIHEPLSGKQLLPLHIANLTILLAISGGKFAKLRTQHHKFVA